MHSDVLAEKSVTKVDGEGDKAAEGKDVPSESDQVMVA